MNFYFRDDIIKYGPEKKALYNLYKVRAMHGEPLPLVFNLTQSLLNIIIMLEI